MANYTIIQVHFCSSQFYILFSFTLMKIIWQGTHMESDTIVLLDQLYLPFKVQKKKNLMEGRDQEN